MSKMSQLHADLNQSARDLGYENFDAAMADGCTIDYETNSLIPAAGTNAEELAKAHEGWLKEKEDILKRLKKLDDSLVPYDDRTEMWEVVHDAYLFIKRGEI